VIELLQKFQLAPDLRSFAVSKDCPIDSDNIAQMLKQAGVAFNTVSVDHTTGVVTVDLDRSVTLAKQSAARNLVRSMPQYLSDIA
jgi:hypothetical protein